MLPSFIGFLVAAGALVLSPVGDDDLAAIGLKTGSLSGTLLAKLILFAKAMFSGQLLADAIFIVITIVVAGLAVRSRKVIPRDWLIVVAALILVTFVAPYSIGEGSFIDARLATLPIIMFLVALPVQRSWNWTTAVVLGLALLRIGMLAAAWENFGDFYESLQVAVAGLPVGSTLISGLGDEPVSPSKFSAGIVSRLSNTAEYEAAWYDGWSPPVRNIASLAVRRGIFVPSVFASQKQQPLFLRPEWRSSWSHHLFATGKHEQDEAVANAKLYCGNGTPINFITFFRHPDSNALLDPDHGLSPGVRSHFQVIHVC